MIARARNALALPLLLVAACGSMQVDLYQVYDVDSLYFGTLRGDGSAVTEEEWQRFLTEVVVSRIDGFTTWDAEGLYHSKSGAVVRERAHVVQIVHLEGKREAEIKEIIAAYKKTFGQESVLRVRGRAGVAFQ